MVQTTKRELTAHNKYLMQRRPTSRCVAAILPSRLAPPGRRCTASGFAHLQHFQLAHRLSTPTLTRWCSAALSDNESRKRTIAHGHVFARYRYERFGFVRNVWPNGGRGKGERETEREKKKRVGGNKEVAAITWRKTWQSDKFSY